MARGPHRPTRLAWGSSGHRAPCHEQLENAELLQRANGLISGRPNQAPPFPTHFPHTVGEVHTASVGTHRRANEQPSRQRAQSRRRERRAGHADGQGVLPPFGKGPLQLLYCPQSCLFTLTFRKPLLECRGLPTGPREAK